MTETARQTAAKCVARVFQGWGHQIRKGKDGALYNVEGADKLTELEKQTLKEAFFFFLDLIEEKTERKDIKPPEKGSPRS